MHRHTSGLAVTSLAGRDSGCTPPSTNLHWVVGKQTTMADFERKSAINVHRTSDRWYPLSSALLIPAVVHTIFIT